jgi:acetyl esterase/lipase
MYIADIHLSKLIIFIRLTVIINLGDKDMNKIIRKALCVSALGLFTVFYSYSATPDEVKTIAQKGTFTKGTKEIFLWTGKAPGSESLTIEEKIEDLSKEPEWKTRRITLVTKPSITAFFPKKPNGIAVIICPGGAFTKLGFDDEGTDIAKWLNSVGITGFVLKYRLPGDGHLNGIDVPLQDAQRAVRLIREKSSELGINPKKIGVMGFSAGGHLAASVGTYYNAEVYKAIDAVDKQSARPDFLACLYPVISDTDEPSAKDKIDTADTLVKKMRLTYQPNLKVTAETPCAFILLANDDTFKLQQHGPRFYRALQAANVPAELHVFLKGGHGFGVRKPVGAIAEWTNMFTAWLKGVGVSE